MAVLKNSSLDPHEFELREGETDGDGQHNGLGRASSAHPWWQHDLPLARTALRCATAVGTTLIVATAQHALVGEMINAYLIAHGCGPV